ncbi:ABC transporter permease [candidate division KSB1 bacterium]|nr:ABC transporter permease [candidate division KSB1 bacterium]
MIKFLIKGLLRDRSRSLFPIIVIAAGVLLTVFLTCWMDGVKSNMVYTSAIFETGHLRVMTRAYNADISQIPNELAIIGIDDLLDTLQAEYPEVLWRPRIRFGGLLDIPDEFGETRDQAPVTGLGIDLLSAESHEKEILNLEKSIVSGRLPQSPGEIVLSDQFARKLNASLGETATLMGSTMYGSMAMYNFTIVGTVNFGMTALDRGTMIADLGDVQVALNMDDAAGEVLGVFRDMLYKDEEASMIAGEFNREHSDEDDEYSPMMKTLKQQEELASFLDMASTFIGVIIFIFVVVMSIVLWNSGLIGGIRRYGEIGVRLAIGESKGHVYRSMILESVVLGIAGSVIGTIIGLAFSYYLQVHGIDITSIMRNASMMMTNVMRARVTPGSAFIGFIPGLIANVIGTAIAGIGIYKRQTSQLFKELEV